MVKSLQPGRVITIYVSKYRHALALVLRVASKMTVLLLCSSEDEEQVLVQSLIDVTEEKMKNVHIVYPFKEVYLPDPPLKHAVVEVSSLLLINITDEVIKIDPLQIISDYQRRQLPSFR